MQINFATNSSLNSKIRLYSKFRFRASLNSPSSVVSWRSRISSSMRGKSLRTFPASPTTFLIAKVSLDLPSSSLRISMRTLLLLVGFTSLILTPRVSGLSWFFGSFRTATEVYPSTGFIRTASGRARLAIFFSVLDGGFALCFSLFVPGMVAPLTRVISFFADGLGAAVSWGLMVGALVIFP